MKMQVVAVVVGALLVIGVQSRPRLHTGWSGLDLTGKMFTLSTDNGGVTFYPGSYSPSWSTPPSSTSSYTSQPTTSSFSSTTFPGTTAAPTRGFSVCVRYMADSVYSFMLRLGTGWRSMTLSTHYPVGYSFGSSFQSVLLTPKFQLFPNVKENMWTSVCLTRDTMTNIIQLFQDSSMSIRTIKHYEEMALNEPVIEFSGFNGQVTDLQLWDYPLSYKEVYSYMTRGFYGSYYGSLISWSNISYINRENSLLEDEYNLMVQQPGGGRGGNLRKRKPPRKVFNMGNQQKKGRLIF